MFNQFFGEESKKVSKWVVFSLMIFSVFLLVKVLADFKKLPNIGKEIYPQSTIMVSGKGEAYAIPDIASFSFSVTEASESVESAQKMLDEKISKALDVLKQAEVAEKDIKTTGYNVYPKYEWNEVRCFAYPCPVGKNELVGYEVSQSITVKVREVKKVGDLVSKIGAVNVSSISGVEFTVDNREEYVAKAREEAITEAKAKAKILAKQLGVRLGKIMYYSDNNNYPVYYGEGIGGGRDMMISSVAPAKAELPQGETKITSEVSITYEIK
jgi:uncharacterized protein YggE